jgi:integrase
VRRVAWIHPDQAKAKKAITVPLSDTAIAVLRRQLTKKRAPEFVDSVFVYQGKPVYQTVPAAWRKALKRAGIRDFRWHDLRHTWASWHVQRGTPLQVLKELGGWETMEMVQRYAHLSTDHLAQWVTPLTSAPAPMLAAI